MLNEEQFRAYDEKLKLFGGLYIYRDGFRVLPYGRTETDFYDLRIVDPNMQAPTSLVIDECWDILRYQELIIKIGR